MCGDEKEMESLLSQALAKENARGREEKNEKARTLCQRVGFPLRIQDNGHDDRSDYLGVFPFPPIITQQVHRNYTKVR